MNKCWLISLTALLTAAPGLAQDLNVSGSDSNVGLSYLGDTSRVGLGVNDDGDWFGEYLQVFGAKETSNWIGEAWIDDESAGGLKLSYHWLGGAGSLASAQQNSVRVWKVFLAADQNGDDDRKATLGFGMENEKLFWGAYLMSALTDERLVNVREERQIDTIRFIDAGQVFDQQQTTIDIFRTFEHPYDQGLGLRLGRYFDDGLWRLRGGLDYEDGDFSSDQLSFSLGLEKLFENTGHSLALGVSHHERDGDFVVDSSDTRATLTWRYNFGHRAGRAWQDPRDFIEQQVQVEVPAEAAVTRTELVANEVTVSDTALFKLDQHDIQPEAAAMLDELARRIQALDVISAIAVTGHTCDLGPEAYNQSLSEKRAKSVVDYLVTQGIPRDQLQWSGQGELSPRSPNTPAQRSNNRRVELMFVSNQPVERQVVVSPATEATTRTETARQAVAGKGVAWVTRALRNPVDHKRTVDTYRYVEADQNIELGTPVAVNALPSAQDDNVTTFLDNPVTIAVLANDSDADGDALTVVSTTSPTSGSVTVNDDGTIIYTPNSGFFGTDTFTYTVRDSFGSEATATVTVQVDERPPVTAGADQASTDRNQPVTIGVLANDAGEGLTITAVGDATNGSVAFSDEFITYTPDQNYVGTDSFTYTITDRFGQTSSATVSVTINAANQAPVANDDEVETGKNDPVTIDVLANDTDADGDTLTIVSVTPDKTEFGTVEIVNNQVLYTPMAEWWGEDEFTYTIEDGFGGTATATVRLTVTQF